MVNYGEHFLLALHVIDLLQLDYSTLLETLECQWLAIIALVAVLDEAYPTKGARSEGRQDMEVVQVQNSFLLTFGSVLDLLW